MTHASPDDLMRVQAYANDLKDALELRDWRISVSPDPPNDPDALASIEPTDGRRIAQLRICHDFCLMPVRARRQVLVHELLHLHMEPVWFTLTQALADLYGREDDRFRLIRGMMRATIEGTVDAISFPLAEGLPLPTGGHDGAQGVQVGQAEGGGAPQLAKGASRTS